MDHLSHGASAAVISGDSKFHTSIEETPEPSEVLACSWNRQIWFQSVIADNFSGLLFLDHHLFEFLSDLNFPYFLDDLDGVYYRQTLVSRSRFRKLHDSSWPSWAFGFRVAETLAKSDRFDLLLWESTFVSRSMK